MQVTIRFRPIVGWVLFAVAWAALWFAWKIFESPWSGVDVDDMVVMQFGFVCVIVWAIFLVSGLFMILPTVASREAIGND